MDEKIFPYTSLCMVTEINEKGVGVLKRLADLENDEFKPQFSSSFPKRKKLYTDYCILPVNFIGVFGWNVMPHFTRQGRDFIDSKFYFEKFPIEVLNLKNCNGKDYLRKKFLNGMSFDFSTEKVLILYQTDQKKYEGVLCTQDDFEQVGEIKKMKSLNLQCFEVQEQDLIQIEDKIFYSKLNLGESIGIFQTKDLVDVIKNKIILHTSRKNFKNLVSKNDLKIFREHLKKFSSKDLKQRENFALEVENKISRRIESAKNNVADFICEMAFVNPNFGAVQNSKNNFYRAGKIITGKDYEIEDTQDFIYTLKDEIGVEGAPNENLLPFAEYLTVAYMNRILLLLAGPNARDIADAFSVTLTGKTAAIFDCANVNSLEDLEIVLNSDDEIICVLNPFAPNFIAYLPELVNSGGKYIFAIYPFVEDLKIEPRSFYNYFLPVFTELIIDRKPARDFSNKYFLSDEFKQEFESKYNPAEVPISSEGRIKKLKGDMQKILEVRCKSVALFADFPLAYVKGKTEKFIADFKGDEKILERIYAFLGTDE